MYTGSVRFAVRMTGIESEAVFDVLKSLDPKVSFLLTIWLLVCISSDEALSDRGHFVPTIAPFYYRMCYSSFVWVPFINSRMLKCHITSHLIMSISFLSIRWQLLFSKSRLVCQGCTHHEEHSRCWLTENACFLLFIRLFSHP